MGFPRLPPLTAARFPDIISLSKHHPRRSAPCLFAVWLGFSAFFWSVSSALAESEGDTLAFPCSPELSPFLSQSEHTISREIDLHHWDRMQIDYWGDDPIPVDHGSLIILDDQFMLIDLHFSKDFPFSTDGYVLPGGHLHGQS